MSGYSKIDVNSENCHDASTKFMGVVPPTQEDVDASLVYERYYPLQDVTSVRPGGQLIFELYKSADGVQTFLNESFIKFNFSTVINIPYSPFKPIGGTGQLTADSQPSAIIPLPGTPVASLKIQDTVLLTGPKTMDNYTVAPVNGFTDLLFPRQLLEINSVTTNQETNDGDILQQLRTFFYKKRTNLLAHSLENGYMFAAPGFNSMGGYCANPASFGGSGQLGIYNGMAPSVWGISLYTATAAKRKRGVYFGGYHNFDREVQMQRVLSLDKTGQTGVGAHMSADLYTNTNWSVNWQPYCPLWHVGKPYPDRVSFRLTLTFTPDVSKLFSKSTQWALLAPYNQTTITSQATGNAVCTYTSTNCQPVVDLIINSAILYVKRQVLGVDAAQGLLSAFASGEEWKAMYMDMRIVSQDIKPSTSVYQSYSLLPGFRPNHCVAFLVPNYNLAQGAIPFVETNCMMQSGIEFGGMNVGNPSAFSFLMDSASVVESAIGVWPLNSAMIGGEDDALSDYVTMQGDAGINLYFPDNGAPLLASSGGLPAAITQQVYITQIYLQRNGKQYPLRFMETRLNLNKDSITTGMVPLNAVIQTTSGSANTLINQPYQFKDFAYYNFPTEVGVVVNDSVLATDTVGITDVCNWCATVSLLDAGRPLSQCDLAEFYNYYTLCLSHDDPVLTMEDFINYFMYCFTMSISGDGETILDPTEDGAVDIIFQMSSPTQMDYTLYLVAFTPKCVTINASRSIDVDTSG